MSLRAQGLDHREHAAPRVLAGVVACAWRSRVAPGAAPPFRVWPDGCVELAFADGRPVLAYGPRETWFDLPLEPGAEYLGLRLRPGAAGALLGIDVSDLAGRVERLDALGPFRLGGGLSASLSLDAVVALLARRAERPADPLVLSAVALMASAPRLGVRGVADRLSVSERQLRRRFTRSVGLPPSAYLRVARINAAASAALLAPSTSWTRLAYDHGFADQAHLTREMATLVGGAPTAVLPAALRASRRA